MRSPRLTLLALLMTNACAAQYDPLCPAGWDEEDTGRCFPPERMYEEFPGDTGVFGYVKQRDCTAHCDDTFEVLPEQRVVVLDAELTAGCGPDDEFGWRDDPSADPSCRVHVVAEVHTDEEGVFTIELPPGEYFVVTDTVVFDGWDGRPVTVGPQLPQFVELYFDAVPI